MDANMPLQGVMRRTRRTFSEDCGSSSLPATSVNGGSGDDERSGSVLDAGYGKRPQTSPGQRR